MFKKNPKHRVFFLIKIFLARHICLASFVYKLPSKFFQFLMNTLTKICALVFDLIEITPVLYSFFF